MRANPPIRVLPSLLLALAPLTQAQQPAPTKPADPIVVLITVDGLPAWIWNNPTLVMPTLRRLASEGALAENLTVSNPSITWINHTTIATGVTPRRHGLLYNGLLVRHGPNQPPTVEPWRDKAELVRAPTIYDAASRAGLKTAQVDWVAILNSGTIDHEFLEIPHPDGRVEREMIAAGLVTEEEIRTFTKGKPIVWRDWIWTLAGCHLLETHRPNLLLFHLLGTDALNHEYGPATPASLAAYAYTDQLIARLLASIDRAGLRDRTTVIVTTDHGFKKVRKVIHPNVALRDAGLVRVERGKVASCDAWILPQGGMALAYVTDPARRAELVPKLRAICTPIEGVAQVLDGDDGPSLGMPTPAENQAMGDLILFAKPGYAFKDAASAPALVEESRGYLGTHGYPASDPELDGILVAWGRGVRPGTRIQRVANVDVAPTIATLLGIPFPDTDGRPLNELLAQPRPADPRAK